MSTMCLLLHLHSNTVLLQGSAIERRPEVALRTQVGSVFAGIVMIEAAGGDHSSCSDSARAENSRRERRRASACSSVIRPVRSGGGKVIRDFAFSCTGETFTSPPCLALWQDPTPVTVANSSNPAHMPSAMFMTLLADDGFSPTRRQRAFAAWPMPLCTSILHHSRTYFFHFMKAPICGTDSVDIAANVTVGAG